jgi:hypothetical protein
LAREKTVTFLGNAPAGRAGERGSPCVRGSVKRVFLLSPANAAGTRAQRLLSAECETELVLRLRGGGVGLGELFSFMSSLYFRGKLTYAQRFAAPPESLPGVLVITPSRGLLPPEQIISLNDLRQMALGRVDVEDERYREPLRRDARRLLEGLGREAEVVLLGSVATSKYIEPLLEVFGERLVFPEEFLGRGDMSRGGLLLKCTREAVELEYVPIARAQKGSKKKAGDRKARKGRRKR